MESMPRHPARRRARTLAALTATTAAVLTLTATPAHPAASAGPVYSGKGWKIYTASGIHNLPPQPFVIVFANATARTKLAPYFKKPAAQIKTVTGVTFTVSSTLDTTPVGTCPTRGRIVVHYSYRPTGKPGISTSRNCFMASTASAAGGHILMDSEYWTEPHWFSRNPTTNESYRRNIASHELGHLAGLAHPNTDLDRDGKVEPYECVKSGSTRPLMCSPEGGYLNSVDAGKFTPPFDVPGLKQLARNWYLR